MKTEQRLIDANALKERAIRVSTVKEHCYMKAVGTHEIDKAPTVDAIPVLQIKAYLQKKLDEWEALGDRRFEPANMWGYNFIMACFDDLERV